MSIIKSIGIEAYKVTSSYTYQTMFYSMITFSRLRIIYSLRVLNIDKLIIDKVIATLQKYKDKETKER